MEIENDFLELYNLYKYPSILCENNQTKPFITKNDFPIDQASLVLNNNYLDQDQFQQNHHHHNQYWPSLFEYPFELAYTNTANSLNKNEYNNNHCSNNYKPFGQAIFANLPPRNVVLDMINGSDWNRLASNTCQEIVKPVSFVAVDHHEVSSCITAENGYYKKVVPMNKITNSDNFNNNSLLPRRRSFKTHNNKTNKANPIKGQWSGDEDRLLIQLVEQYGLRKWSQIAQMLPGRIGKQCRERWHNHLRPDIKKETWSEEEDKVLIESHVEIGNKWAEIAKRLPGRTENSIKNHWNATKRRQNSKRKSRSKCPRPSLLQEYIKSLNLDSSSSTTTRQHNNKSDNHRKTTHQPYDVDKSLMMKDLLVCDNGCCFEDYGDDNMMIFQEGNNSYETIDSLFDDIVLRSCDDHNKSEVVIVDLPAENDNSFEAVMFEEKFDYDQVTMKKKEMDLVEMISHQVNM